jgi:hypothetical protein
VGVTPSFFSLVLVFLFWVGKEGKKGRRILYRSDFILGDIPYTINVDAINLPANIFRIRKTPMKKKLKGRPKKKKTEVLMNVNVRVSQAVKKIVESWKKRKRERLERAIKAEAATEE